jgi:hypothetical protein
VALTGFKSIHVNPLMVFSANLFLVITVGTRSRNSRVENQYLLGGLVSGALLSSLYAVYQQIGVRLGLPFVVPPLNNLSFALFSDGAYLTDTRAYAFCSEPSVLAALLIPMLAERLSVSAGKTWREGYLTKWIPIILLVGGLLATASLSIAVSLPLVLFSTYVLSLKRLSDSAKYLLSIVAILLLGLTLVLATEAGQEVATLVTERVGNIRDDQSFIVRAGSKAASLEILRENPLFGAGIIPDPAYFISKLPDEAASYQQTTGVDSISLLILSGQGIVGFMCFAALMALGLLRSSGNVQVRVLLCATVIVVSLQVGNPMLYGIWVTLGLALANRPEDSPGQLLGKLKGSGQVRASAISSGDRRS